MAVVEDLLNDWVFLHELIKLVEKRVDYLLKDWARLCLTIVRLHSSIKESLSDDFGIELHWRVRLHDYLVDGFKLLDFYLYKARHILESLSQLLN